MKKSVRFIVFFTLCMNCYTFIFSQSVAQNKVTSSANRKTAIRFLKLAEDYLSKSAWDSALTQAKMGLAYDETVADLWYVQASALSNLGKTKAEILPVITYAMTNAQWVDYNKDGARILYADLLSDTGEYEKAISVLDEKPFLYSSDAEFIRIKSYYRINTKESIDNARNKINSARKIYSNDARFPKLFFRYEYALNTSEVPAIVQSIADAFIARMPQYDKSDAETEIYASLFAVGETHTRLLQAFSARNLSHPLYAGAAVIEKLLTQNEAIEYFFNFADDTIPLSTLVDFARYITEEDAKSNLLERLNAYSGLLTIDTTGDLETNLCVKYDRGRPSFLSFDENNDGVNEWSAKCDFGVPTSLDFTKDRFLIEYGIYPSVDKAIFTVEGENPKKSTYHFVANSFNWTPFSMEINKELNDHVGAEFFVPVIGKDVLVIDEESIKKISPNYEVSSTERDNATISFTVVDGNIQVATYYSNDEIYAKAVFENNMPVSRAIDNDGNGILETIEFFGYDLENKMNIPLEDTEKLSETIFGNKDAKGIYIKAIQVDKDGDTVVDFVEEYLADNGKISSWDTNGDGNWNIRYERLPQKQNEDLIENSSFYIIPENKLVVVTLKNGTPTKVVSGEVNYNVYNGKAENVYWIGKKGSDADEALCLSKLQESKEFSRVVDTNNTRFLTIQIDKNTYILDVKNSGELVNKANENLIPVEEAVLQVEQMQSEMKDEKDTEQN